MKVYLNSITGLDDAMVSLLMSKRSWTRKKEIAIRNITREYTGFEGEYIGFEDETNEFTRSMDKIIKYGVECGHTELLRGIELSFTVEGLHRAGQDDWDSHVRRMQQCVRSSTRLATFSDGEKSDWYKGKIFYPFEAFDFMKISIPDSFEYCGETFIKTDFGYIREDLKEDKDVKRGLYPEAIPSTFTFKCTYPDLAHIIQMRDSIAGNANKEVQQVAEQIKILVTGANKWLGNNLNKVKSDPGDLREEKKNE